MLCWLFNLAKLVSSRVTEFPLSQKIRGTQDFKDSLQHQDNQCQAPAREPLTESHSGENEPGENVPKLCKLDNGDAS